MAEDVINSYDTSAYTLVCFSIGKRISLSNLGAVE